MLGIALLSEMCGTVGMIPEGISGKIIALALLTIGIILYIIVEVSNEQQEVSKK